MVEEVSTMVVDLDVLELGLFTPRMVFDEKWIRELAEDIERHGQQKPILVRPHPGKLGIFQVIDGEHRCRAMKLLGRESIRAEVRGLKVEEAAFLAMRINELHGKRLSSLEEGTRMLRLNTELGWTEEKIAEKFGRSRQWVADRIRIAKNASEDLRECHARGKITATHAREIVELPKEAQPKVVRKVVEENLTTRQTALLAHVLKEAEGEEEKRRILEAPVKALAEAYEEDVEKFREAATSEKPELVETFKCPKCGTRLVVNWIDREISWCED